MFRNPNGILVPGCEDCIYGGVDIDCPDNAIADVVDEYKGVAELPCFKPRATENHDRQGEVGAPKSGGEATVGASGKVDWMSIQHEKDCQNFGKYHGSWVCDNACAVVGACKEKSRVDAQSLPQKGEASIAETNCEDCGYDMPEYCRKGWFRVYNAGRKAPHIVPCSDFKPKESKHERL